MKRKNLSIVSDQRQPEEDSPERFKRRTHHLKTGTGQPLESTLFKLMAAKAEAAQS